MALSPIRLASHDSRYALNKANLMPDPILPGRLGLYASMLHYGLVGYRDFAREHAIFFERLKTDEGPLAGRRVLDVGCGKSYWLSLLLASSGAEAVGVDTELVESRRGISKYRHLLKSNGVERTLRTAVWDLLFARGYYHELERCIGARLPHEQVELHVYDGMHLPLPDASIDLVVSHEVFEHISDVPAVLAELARVLRPDGQIYIYIHNFTSLSGGHHIAWKHPDTRPSKIVAPWDHLRSRVHTDIPSWLNGLREHEYRAMFEELFEIEEWRETAEEGRGLLTDEIRSELVQFNERELLTKGFLVRARLRLSPKTNILHG
jgi:SAM-dependent methyltransferase